jgi:hypothetical protein
MIDIEYVLNFHCIGPNVAMFLSAFQRVLRWFEPMMAMSVRMAGCLRRAQEMDIFAHRKVRLSKHIIKFIKFWW